MSRIINRLAEAPRRCVGGNRPGDALAETSRRCAGGSPPRPSVVVSVAPNKPPPRQARVDQESHRDDAKRQRRQPDRNVGDTLEGPEPVSPRCLRRSIRRRCRTPAPTGGATSFPQARTKAMKAVMMMCMVFSRIDPGAGWPARRPVVRCSRGISPAAATIRQRAPVVRCSRGMSPAAAPRRQCAPVGSVV